MPEPKSGVLPLDDAPKPVTKILFVKNTPKKSVAVYSGKLFICQDFFADAPQNAVISGAAKNIGITGGAKNT